jgi:hypothetical protein
MVDIRTNLLKNRPTLSEKDYRQERNFLRASVFALIVVVVVVVAISLWNFVLSRQLSSLTSEVAASTKQMDGYVQASTQQIYLKTRLALITSFLQQRSTAREALQRVLSTSIPGTHIAAVAFATDNVLSIQVASDTAVALKGVLDYYQADTGYFTQVVSEGIARAKDGSYLLTLDLTLPKGGT